MITPKLKEAIPIRIDDLIEAGNNHIIHQHPIPSHISDSFNDLIIKLDEFFNDEFFRIVSDLGLITEDYHFNDSEEEKLNEYKKEILGKLSLHLT